MMASTGLHIDSGTSAAPDFAGGQTYLEGNPTMLGYSFGSEEEQQQRDISERSSLPEQEQQGLLLLHSPPCGKPVTLSESKPPPASDDSSSPANFLDSEEASLPKFTFSLVEGESPPPYSPPEKDASPPETQIPLSSPSSPEDPTLLSKPASAPKLKPSSASTAPGLHLSFAGCGFLGIYHVGASACLKKYAPELLLERIAGASAGALAGACLLCDADLGVITSSVLKTATEARARALGPFSPTFNVEKLLREGLLAVLPANAHQIVSGRLFVSVTRVSDGKNVLLSHFETREELVQTLLCSSFIPGFSGYRPLKIRGVRYMDGGFSNNLPELDLATVTVSPFCGEADVCPKDNTAGVITISLANTSIEVSRENLQRFARILFPPPPETLSKMCQQGFNDALDFLQRNNLINCTRCVAVQSTVPLPAPDNGGVFSREEIEEKKQNVLKNKMAGGTYKRRRSAMGGIRSPWVRDSEDSDQEYDGVDDQDRDSLEEWEDNCEGCPDCRAQRQEAILDELPEAVGAILQEAIEVANASVSLWAGLSSTRKLFALLTLPLRYSLKMPVKIAKGVVSTLPTLPSTLLSMVPSIPRILPLLDTLISTITTVLLTRRHAAAREQPSTTPAEAAAAGLLPHYLHHHLHHHQHRRGSVAPGGRMEQEFSCNVAITEFSGGAPPLQTAEQTDWDTREGIENEALNRLAQQYAERSSRCSSLIVQSMSRATSRAPSRAASRVSSRAVSRAVSRRASISESLFGDRASEGTGVGAAYGDEGDDGYHPPVGRDALNAPEDAFDKILSVTGEQESVMAYYYMDENNRMQVTEIFDMSNVIPPDTADDPYEQHHHHHYQQQPQHFLTVPHQQQQQQQQHDRQAPPKRLSGILRNSFSGGADEQSSPGAQHRYIHDQLAGFRERMRSGEFSSDDDGDDGDDGSVDNAPGGEGVTRPDEADDDQASNTSSSRSPSEPEADQHLGE